jgi:2-polyprenyl-6-methoxyphenol hydroxylase-like FAD-dependent oxidoreductase
MREKGSDVIVVGGGLAGSTLSIALARAGVDVTLLEAETRFRDRVRGEILFPWGVSEARRLGIYDLLIAAGAKHLPHRDVYTDGVLRKRNDFAEESNEAESPLSFEHAAVQEALIEAAAAVSVRVIRGAEVASLRPGCTPEVTFTVDGETVAASAAIVVGADGRSSRIRRLGGFEVNHGSGGLLTTGVALSGVDIDPEALSAAFNTRTRELAALFPQTEGRARAYLTVPATSGRQDVRTLGQLKERLVSAGMPASMLASAEAAGPLATFDGTPKWVDVPFMNGVALVGDAAATSDPAFGQGMALALRDVRVFVDAYLGSENVGETAQRYVDTYAEYRPASRAVSSLLSEAQFSRDESAEQLRSSELWRSSAGALRATQINGPNGVLCQVLQPHNSAAVAVQAPPSAVMACQAA